MCYTVTVATTPGKVNDMLDVADLVQWSGCLDAVTPDDRVSGHCDCACSPYAHTGILNLDGDTHWVCHGRDEFGYCQCEYTHYSPTMRYRLKSPAYWDRWRL